MNQEPNQEQYDAGYEAAKTASSDGAVQIDKKPYGQTSPDNYSYTYWYIEGWNNFADSNTQRT